MASNPHASLQKHIGYTFKESALLEAALTHPSASQRNKSAALQYERLEFLGDRVLGLVVAEWLLEKYPNAAEGTLARALAATVKRDSLLSVADAIQLETVLRVAKGEQQSGRGRANILADATEALIGALYLDGGLKAAQKFIRLFFADLVCSGQSATDPKTALQEWAQAKKLPVPAYSITSREGPAHEPIFVVTVSVGKEKPVTGTGKSKQAAEKAAAINMLAQLGQKQ